MVVGKVVHLAFDAVLVSAFLAGVRRSTGLTYAHPPPNLKQDSSQPSNELKKWVDNYLWVGEVFLDQSVALMSSSGYFERKR